MKKFLYSFLGTVAGIWISVFLGFLLLIVIISVSMAKSGTGAKISVEDNSILRINLSGIVEDRMTPVNLMDQLYGNSERSINLNDLVDAISSAKDDKHIDGIYLYCGGSSIGMAQAQAIIAALEDFKESGKWIYSYADTYTQGDYYVATAADSIFINPVGMVDIHGLSATTMYFKDLLDKVGVEAQVVKVGTYKSAVEPFMLNDMSDANREQINQFLGNIWSYMKNHIAKRRKVSADSIDSWANSFVFAQKAPAYMKAHIIDGIKYEHQITELLTQKTGKIKEPSFVDFEDYSTVTEAPIKKSARGAKNIAVLYALGDITEAGESGIASQRLVPVILDLANDESIDGLILRVNSGGGSAYASEQIWEALEQFKKISKKPFYVSMSDMAASGGYYISCGAKKIYAEPLTLTGSIGIFGIIPNFQPLMKDKLGINSVTISTNRGAMPTFTAPMTEEQRNAMQSYVNQGYELFVSRCATGRRKTVEQIKAIAEGRVWDGQSALKNGLVDKLGGLDMAIADMAKELKADSYYITEYPAVKIKWWEMLLDMDDDLEANIFGGDAVSAVYYLKALRSVRDMDPLQCRTDFIKLH